MPWLLIFIAAIVLLLLLRRALFPKDNSKATKLMNTYRVMTREKLDSTPDDQLVKAVIGNLLAKAEDAKCDPYTVIPALSQGRCAVYSVWLFARELQSGDSAALRRSGQFGFSELAADGLELLGFDALAANLRDYLQTADDARAEAMKTALETTDVNAVLTAFIRDNADAFCDGELC